MNLDRLTPIAEVEAFLDGSQPVAFRIKGSKDDRYLWIDKTLRQFHYRHLGKRERGIIRRLLARITGYSPATLSRLIQQSRQCGQPAEDDARLSPDLHGGGHSPSGANG